MTQSIFNKPIDQLETNDLTSLIQSGIRENEQIEYKRSINLDSEKGKIDLAKDVSAMANSGGGRIFYGISQKDDERDRGPGIPDKITPLTDTRLIQQITDIAVSTVKPRPRFSLSAPIKVENGFCLVLEVRQSLAGPIMVIHPNEHRHYRRVVAQNVLMTNDEIKRAFQDSSVVLRQTNQNIRDTLEDHSYDSLPPSILFAAAPIGASQESADPSKVNLQWFEQLPKKLPGPLEWAINTVRYTADGISGFYDKEGGFELRRNGNLTLHILLPTHTDDTDRWVSGRKIIEGTEWAVQFIRQIGTQVVREHGDWCLGWRLKNCAGCDLDLPGDPELWWGNSMIGKDPEYVDFIRLSDEDECNKFAIECAHRTAQASGEKRCHWFYDGSNKPINRG